MSEALDDARADPGRIIADLRGQLAVRTAERDQARAERDAAVDQQTATAEVLQVINSSPGELAPVFDAMLEKAMRLCEAPFGALLRFDGKVFRAIAARDTSGAAAVLGGPVEPDPGSASERLLLGDEVVHIPDVVDTEAYRSGVPSRLKLVEMIGARTALWVALRKNDVMLGDFALYRKEVRPFTDKQIALVQNFAAQAVIAMENARLLTETREALEQQTATAEVLQVINSSPGDLAPVFDAMLEKATSLCGAEFGLLFTWEGECFHPVAWRGISRELLAVLREPFRPQPGTLTWRIAHGENIVSSADLLEALQQFEEAAALDPAYRNGIARVRALVEFGGARSHIGIALRKDDALLGHLSIYRQEVRPFTDKQIALLQNFAAQAVIAMENARLITETREALEQQTATAEVLQVINSSPGNLAPVFDAILERAHVLCGATYGSLTVADGEYFSAVAMHGFTGAFADLLRQPFRPSPISLQHRLLRGEPLIHIPDISTLESLSPRMQAVMQAGFRTLLVIPLRKDAALLGHITALRQEVQPFTDKQIALLQNFAAQAVIAMENARLLTETREALEQQTATAEVLGVINSSPGDLKPVFDAILEKAHTLCGAVDGGLTLREGERLRAVALRGAYQRRSLSVCAKGS